MKAVVISNFNYYTIRTKDILALLASNQCETTYITGHYDTMNKQVYHLDIPQVIQLPIKEYQQNISFDRIVSHLDFARQVYKELDRIQPDIIYALVPPNFVASYVRKYQKKHPQVKVIFDVFDMWPETFPKQTNWLYIAPFKMWRYLRNHAIKKSTLTFTECRYFEEALKKQTHKQIIQTVYPAQKSISLPIAYQPPQQKAVHLCYLGSVNNIIDLDRIEQLFVEIARYKPIVLHIIGSGEKIHELLDRTRLICQEVKHYGYVYDEKEKQAIFNQCAFGLNVLKPTVFIGLTLKSIDYFNFGMPIINTVKGDTEYFVEKYGVGLNLTNDGECAKQIVALSNESIQTMKEKSKQLFADYFTKESLYKTMQDALDQKGVFT